MFVPIYAGGRWYDENIGEIVAWAQIDAEDADQVEPYRWHLDPNGYAMRYERRDFPLKCPSCEWTTPAGIHAARSVSNHHTKMHGERITTERRRRLMMHRVIAGLEPGDPLQVDHINRDRLDNRRSNLRIVEAGVQAHNQGKQRSYKGGPTESRYRGVYMVKKRGVFTGKWKAEVAGTYLGCFGSEEAAAEAARLHRLKTMAYATD